MNKKGVSVLIGYVLLISFVIVISVVVYQLLKTYAPTEIEECPSGTSIILKDYQCNHNRLNLTIQNNGLFNVGGLFVYVSIDDENNEIPNLNFIEGYNLITETNIQGGVLAGDSLLFDLNNQNSLIVGEDRLIIMNLMSNDYTQQEYIGGELINHRINYIGLTPVRFQKENRKTKFVSCGDSHIIQKLDCPEITA